LYTVWVTASKKPKAKAYIRNQNPPIHHLIEHKALPNSVNRHGDTPLLMAVNAEEEEVVKLLIAKGADPFQPCKVTRLKDGHLTV
jgi:ankyrin repeat protein